ncbi:MAG: Na(+)/H(+) antiporter subunit D [Melioribacteraceae bacterium]|nr:MAG: Na(+)/H(+) antiporter subunit D [Melioribacteraceae bacterium]
MPINMMIIPAYYMIFGALILPLLPQKIRSGSFLLFPLLALITIWSFPIDHVIKINFLNYELILGEFNRLNRIFGTIFSIIAIIGGVYSYHLKEKGQQSAALLYAGGALGVTFAGDYFTLFVFWELMAVASTYLIWARRTKESANAGMRYLIVHLFGGSLLLAGIILNIYSTGSIIITSLTPDGSISSWLILVGVALNTAIPPLHAWLADAYPKATVTGAVFLSAFTTKSAVLILIKIFAGWEVLIFFGVMMALYGVVYAVLANDIREILAYHIISQVGYMVAGVGIGTEMAINGTTAHAFSHILYKALLFMGAGVVLHTTGRSKLTELGGIAKKQPVTLWLYMIGAFSISGFPLFNGFISKSMVVSAAGEAHFDTAMLLLLLASVGTFLHTGLKLPYFTWWSKSKEEIEPTKPPVNMHVGMLLAAILCTLFGVYPTLLYDYLPFTVNYEPYTIYHLTESIQILTFTFIAFWLLRKKLEGEPTLALDTDWFYRRPARLIQKVFVDSLETVFNYTEKLALSLSKEIIRVSRNPLILFDKSESDRDYDPDLHRATTHLLLMLIILSFAVFFLFSIII